VKVKNLTWVLLSPAIIALSVVEPVSSGRGELAPVSNGNEPAAVEIIHPSMEPFAIPDGAVTPVLTALSEKVSANFSDTAMILVKNLPWDKLEFSGKKLVNNTWGAGPGENLTSGIFRDTGRSFGWYWERNNPVPCAGETKSKPIYPSVRIGGSPWEASTTASFPVRLGDLKTLNLDYTYLAAPTGTFNLAYDIFLSDTNVPDANPKPQAEVMIWLQNTMLQPASSYKGEFSDGNNTFKLYSWVMSNGREYYSFVLQDQNGPSRHSSVNALQLLGNLGLDPGWYLHGIELGNEVISGSGKIAITRLAITVNGVTL
jgi:hypothetical protein